MCEACFHLSKRGVQRTQRPFLGAYSHLTTTIYYLGQQNSHREGPGRRDSSLLGHHRRTQEGKGRARGLARRGAGWKGTRRLCSRGGAAAEGGGTRNLLHRHRTRGPRRLPGHSQQPRSPRALLAGSARPRCLGRAPAPLTVVLALDKGLPLPEPLHADAVDDPRRLLCLERLVQLGRAGHRRQRGRQRELPAPPSASPGSQAPPDPRGTDSEPPGRARDNERPPTCRSQACH